MTEEEAVARTVEALETFYRNGVNGYQRGKPAADRILEKHLGPLDWSLDGDGFALLRKVAKRVCPRPDIQPAFRPSSRLKYYDRYELARAAIHRADERRREVS